MSKLHLANTVLPSVNGGSIEIDINSKQKVVCILVICNHCPYVIAYVERIRKLYKKYHTALSFYCINANDSEAYPQDSFENMKLMEKELELDGNYLYDEAQEFVKALGASRTPEAFVFVEGELYYQGAIDDNWQNNEDVKEKYLEDALDLALSNKKAEPSFIPPVGCTVKWKN